MDSSRIYFKTLTTTGNFAESSLSVTSLGDTDQ